MASFELDPELLKHAHRLGRVGRVHVLLARNADVPWFMLVPETSAIELCDLSEAEHARLMALAHRLGRAVRERFASDKLNVAAIGNIVAQMHLHVIGRRRDDPHWPGVLWGAQALNSYEPEAVAEIRDWLAATALAPDFEAGDG